MGGLFGNLTKTGVDTGEGTQYYSQPAEAAISAARASVAPTYSANSPAQIPEEGAQAEPSFKQATPAFVPKIAKPSFREAATDQYGNLKPSTPGLTKAGVLMKYVLAGVQGGLAGAGGNGFGEGFQRAQTLPFQRARMAQDQQRGEIQNQLAQEQVKQLPFIRQQQELNIQEAQSQIALRNAQTEAAKALAGQRQLSTEEQIQMKAAIAEKYGFKQGTPEFNQFVLGVQAPKADTNVTELELWRQQNPNAPISDYWRSRNTSVVRHTGGGGSGAPIGSESDIDILAKSLVDPRNLTSLKDVASMRGDMRVRVFAAAKRLDPNFDPGLTNQRIRFLQNYEDPKGRAAINRQAINNILQHGADLKELNEKYRARTFFKPLNTPINMIMRAFGSEAYTEFATVNSVLKDELALYFAGGYAPTQDQQTMWNKIQSDEATPAQTEAFAREVARLAFRRASTFNSQFRKNMGYDDPDMITPEGVNAADRLGLAEEVKKFGSGGMIGGSGSGGRAKGSGTDGKNRPPLDTFERGK